MFPFRSHPIATPIGPDSLGLERPGDAPSPLSTGTRSLTAGDMVIPSTNHNAVGGSPEPLQHLVL